MYVCYEYLEIMSLDAIMDVINLKREANPLIEAINNVKCEVNERCCIIVYNKYTNFEFITTKMHIDDKIIALKYHVLMQYIRHWATKLNSIACIMSIHDIYLAIDGLVNNIRDNHDVNSRAFAMRNCAIGVIYRSLENFRKYTVGEFDEYAKEVIATRMKNFEKEKFRANHSNYVATKKRFVMEAIMSCQTPMFRHHQNQHLVMDVHPDGTTTKIDYHDKERKLENRPRVYYVKGIAASHATFLHECMLIRRACLKSIPMDSHMPLESDDEFS